MAAASLVLIASPARADWVAKDGNGAIQTFKSWIVGLIHHPGHVMEGINGGAPVPVAVDPSGNIGVNIIGGAGTGGGPATAISGAFVDCWNATLGCQNATAWDGSAASATQLAVDKYAAAKTEATRALLAAALQDTRPASSTITAADAATSTVAGQGSVTLVTGTPTANSFQTQAINYASSANIITTGTFVATLQLEGSPDGGVTFVPISGLLRGASLTTATITGPSVISAEVAGFTHVRVRASAYTSGTATVRMTFSAASGPVKILNGVKQVDSTGADATDTTNHAVKVNIVAGASSGAVAQGSTTSGQTGGLGQAATTTAAPTYTTGTTNPTSTDIHGSTRMLNMDSAGNPLDPAAPGNCGPTSTFIQCATKAGQPTLDAGGAPIVPQSAAATRTLTGTNLTLNTNTTICPAATNPVATEIYFTTAGVGIGINGQTLTTATPGTTTTSSPDLVSTAGMYYLAPVGVSNAITAYGPAGVVRCIQTTRQ